MKIYLKTIMALFCIVILLSGCSEDKNPMPSESHPDGWNTATADNFHGSKVLETNYASCKSCHGTDLKGGKSGVSCFTCHQTYPHPDEWTQFNSDSSHAAYIKETTGAIDYCKNCHGDDLQGGKSGIACSDCH